MKKKDIDKTLFKPLLCRNCGFGGHIYKNCPHPIMSFGLICYKIDENKDIKYLMLQRKDSLSFMEFIKGKYNIDDFDYIKILLSNMTISEKNMIINDNFDNIWNYLWCQNPNNPIKNTKEYIESKTKFTTFISIPLYINYIKSIIGLYNEQEWGFPKGRRKLKELDIDCAIREFYEETRIKKEDIYINTNTEPFEEIFFGTNSVLYKHSYYIAKLINNINCFVDYKCLEQIREIRSIKWFDYNEVISHIKKYNIERIELFKYVHLKILEIESSS